MPQFAANLTMLFTDLPTVERFGAARAAGFGAVELLFPYEDDVDAIEAALRAHELEMVLFDLPVGDFAAGERGLANDPARVEEFQRGAVMTAELAERYGTPLVNCLVGKAMDGVPAADQRRTLVENLRSAAAETAKRGVKLLVEPLNTIETPGFLIGTARDGLDLIDAVGHDNLWLQLDVYHEQRMAGNLVATIRDHIDRIAHIQIADSPDRHQPGSGEINYRYVLDAIDASGYDGWVSLEFVPSPDTATALAEMRQAGLLTLARCEDRSNRSDNSEENSMAEKLGFIGLGIMGEPMARNLLAAGFELVIHNRSQAVVDRLDAEFDGVTAATSPREVGQAVSIVITMLPDSPDVNAVVFGADGDGLIEAMGDGDLLIDMSTIAPATAIAVNDALLERGASALDAPVSGGDQGAIAGTLSIMVGGSEAGFERALPIFEVLGGTVTHCGDAGAGQTVKACNQIAVAVNYAAASEALVLGAKAGVDPEKIIQVLNGGLAASRVMELRGPTMIEGKFDPGFRIDLHRKDLGIIMESGKEFGVALPVTALVSQLYDALSANGKGDLDHSALITAIETMANFKVADR